jgi:hypothetical protein
VEVQARYVSAVLSRYESLLTCIVTPTQNKPKPKKTVRGDGLCTEVEKIVEGKKVTGADKGMGADKEKARPR